jgi:hypothetical protein
MKEIDLRFNNLDYLGTVNIKHNKSSESLGIASGADDNFRTPIKGIDPVI